MFGTANNCNHSTNSSEYDIHNTYFVNNAAFESDPRASSYIFKGFQGQGRGGGLYFTLRGNTNLNRLSLEDCKFIGNSATTWGGGLYLSLRDNTSHNTVLVRNCEFINNKCSEIGGGGAELNFLTNKGTSKSNKVVFTDCNFTQNSAKTLGGGLSFASSRENGATNVEILLNNTIRFDTCTWTNNTASLGSAVDIKPSIWDVLGNGILPHITFSHCTFRENEVRENVTNLGKGVKQKSNGIGTMLVSNFVVHFEGLVQFQSNIGSGIYLQSGIVNIKPHATLQFENNTAKFGAAIALYAFSVIYVANNTVTEFIGNVASIRGGAIYAQSMDMHERVASRSCFIQRASASYSNDTFIYFDNNKALPNVGNSIYASSLKPCCEPAENTTTKLECIGEIKGLQPDDITTSHARFGLGKESQITKMMNIVPGAYNRIPIIAYNEFDKEIPAVYDVSLQHENSIKLNDKNVKSLSYVNNTTLRFINTDTQMQINSLKLTKGHETILFDIATIECPPGHILKNSMCTCDASNFKGIWKCDRGRKIASILNGFWIGLCKDGRQCSGNCHFGLCNNNLSNDLTTRIRDTHKVLCSRHREGKLCGKCIDNYSVYFHSDSYRCDSESNCKYGILLYILSEILPLTIIFIIIVAFNISFTTGAVSGLILYAQIIDSFVNNVHEIAHFEELVGNHAYRLIDVLTEIYIAIYEVFNLNYFSVEEISFCLWKGATTLDVIVWKYVTIVYAFVLIVVTILLLNTTRCKRKLVFWRPQNFRSSVINGFSAFLVMCYSQCAKVSFQLLTTTALFDEDFTRSESVILYNGELHLFKSSHIKYAVPALVFMIAIVILPPVLLFLYPLSFKILALCRLSELRIVNSVSNIIPVQFFDSFQSCYKDNFRFFAAMYFLYRVVPLILFEVTSDIAQIYFSFEVFLIIALVLTAVLQPYKRQCHNTTDTLIFANLALINGITWFNYQKINEGHGNMKQVRVILSVMTSFRLLLIYLPLLYVVACVIIYLVKWVKRKLKNRKISQLHQAKETLLDSTYLPPLRNRLSVYPEDEHFYEMK